MDLIAAVPKFTYLRSKQRRIFLLTAVPRLFFLCQLLNRANSSDTETPFLDLNLCISNGTVPTKIYD